MLFSCPSPADAELAPFPIPPLTVKSPALSATRLSLTKAKPSIELFGVKLV